MNDTRSLSVHSLSASLFSEILVADQLARSQIARNLPKGMEISHFSVLNHLSAQNLERTPAQLAKTFHVTKGAMTNTLSKLEWAGHVHIRPDWDDARRKMVSISPAGRKARDAALSAIAPMMSDVVEDVGVENVRTALPILRALRQRLSERFD